ncbi:TPA: RNA ligase family protein [Clostridium perfringens]
MKRVIEIIKELKSHSGRIDKENILKRNKDNELFKEVLKFTYDPYIVTGISKKKLNKKVKFKPYDTEDDITDMMAYLTKNNTGRDKDIIYIQNWLRNQDDKEILSEIITKDLKCGITAKTINKVFEGLIREFNVMLASGYFKDDNDKKVKGDFILTTKLDGVRNVVIKENGVCKFFSRQGQVVEGFIEIEEEFKSLPDNMVYDGELLLKNDKGLASDDLYRETMKVVRKDGIKKNVEFHVFDILSLEEFQKGKSKSKCIDRKKLLGDLLAGKKFERIIEVPMLYVGSDKNKIIELLDKAKRNNEEGIMLNKCDGLYECKRSKEILKVKQFNDADMKVIDIIEGDGRNKGKLGSITVEFEYEGRIHTCDVGSGFEDEEREKYFKNKDLLIDKIVTIKYFEVSKNQQGGVSLRFPTWTSRIRNDKKEISMN